MLNLRGALVVALVALLWCGVALARPSGHWDETVSDPAVQEWYAKLKQPDNPIASCCGEADAYWADSFEVQGDQYVAIITDGRTDIPGRPIRAPGTRIVIPNHKLKYDAGNPTGHGVVFVGVGGQVFCYIAPGGI